MQKFPIFQNRLFKKAFHRIVEPLAQKICPAQVELLYRMHRYQISNAPLRACHLHELFVCHNGDIYPCCRTWHNECLRIGNITDSQDELRQKLYDLRHSYCQCKKYRLRNAFPTEKPRITFLHLELSLVCQADCAMCSVGSPNWKGSFHNYDTLKDFIHYCQPEHIAVQGGEVLVQKKSLEWIQELKNEYPDITFSIVTNGNVQVDMLPVVEQLFETVTVSIVGFQPETYQKIMGLNFEKTLRFVEELINTKRVNVGLYYLLTPINIHETDLFLRWAIKVLPECIRFADAYLADYIKVYAPYDYWNKIFQRTSNDIKSTLLQHKSILIENRTRIEIDLRTKMFFDLNDGFITQNGFDHTIYCEEL